MKIQMRAWLGGPNPTWPRPDEPLWSPSTPQFSPLISAKRHAPFLMALLVCGLIEFARLGTVRAEPTEPSTPETVIRQAVLANERRDLEGMAQLFLKDADVESFGIAGLKFVGWNDLEQVLRSELLVIAGKCRGLRGLDETTDPLRVLLEIHEMRLPFVTGPLLRHRIG